MRATRNVAIFFVCCLTAAAALSGCSDDPVKTTPTPAGDVVSDSGGNTDSGSSGGDGTSSGGDGAVTSNDGGGSSSGGDVTSKVPQPPTLCHPCKTNSECIAVSGKKSFCNNHGGLGFYCGAGCATDDDCRSDAKCVSVDDVTGASHKQCVPKGSKADAIGECFCSAEAVDKSLETTCFNALKKDGKTLGQCNGTRSCGKSGLSKCDAQVPSAEVCDGKDNDCSGKADDNVCDDGQPCTNDVCKAGGGCENTPTKGSCDDGDPCTSGDNCGSGTCKGSPNTCDDANPCTKDSCVPGEGCKNTKISGCNQCKDNKGCDDSDPCTTDVCATVSGSCSNKPKTCDDGDACTIDSCEKATGTCTSAPGGKCSGTQGIPFSAKFNCNSPANALWTLDKGQPGGPAWGFDATPAPPAAKSPVCSLNFNNGKDFQCPAGAKNVSGTATSPWFDATDAHPKARIRVFFQLGGTWEKNNNDELRLEYTLDGKQWNLVYDAHPNNTPTQWQNRSISIGAVKGKKFRLRFRFFTINCVTNTGTGPFIDDLRIEDTACHANADCATTSKCQVRGCINGSCYTVNKCNDGDACTQDSCDSKGTCTFKAVKEGKPCADNNACTSQKVCTGGKCLAKNTEPDGTSCNDGRQCTIKDQCQGGKCKGTVACDDGNPCTADSCAPLFAACFHEPITGACSDNSACTSNDKCALGICSGTKKDCDDNNACTDDGCDAVDGNCTHKGQADAGPSGSWKCDDGDSCTVDTCDTKSGACTHKTDSSCGSTVTVPYKQPFECGSASSKAWNLTGTVNGPGWGIDSDPTPPGAYAGTCSLNFNNGTNFTCPTGATKVAGDATSPWIDATKVTGSQLRMKFRLSGSWEYTNADEFQVRISTNGTSWQTIYDTSNGNVNYWYLRQLNIPQYAGKKFKIRFAFFTTNCTKNTGAGPFVDNLEVWNAGCQTAADCSDGSNKCQTWTCTPSKTCSVKYKSCKDNKPCTSDSCNAKTGQCAFPFTTDGASCNDNDACTYPDRCQAGQCHGAALNCNDKSACTKDSCNSKKGCVYTAVCSDGDACTSDLCDEATQKCTFPKAASGAVCDDNDVCTTFESCGNGKCVGISATVGVLVGQTISNPTAIVIDKSGTVYVVSRGQHRIYRVASGKASIYAGSGSGYKDGALTAARFNGPHGAAMHGGELYVSDTYNYRIRNVSGGQVTTIAGSNAGFADGKGAKARFNQPRGITADSSGTMYVADTYNHRIRRVTSAGDVKTFTGSSGGFLDGPANVARFNSPHDVAIAKNGELYVADYNNHRIRKVSTTGAVSTLAGGAVHGFVDGLKLGARFYRPTGVTFSKTGALWVADYYNSAIRKIDTAGNVTTVTGKKGYGYTNGSLGNARFARPWNLAFDAKGVALIADYNNSRVRTITPGSGAACNDNNPCTADKCSPTTGVCENTPTSKCDDKDPCTLDLCNPKDGGCSTAPNTCDDGDSCTVGTCSKANGGCSYKDVASCNELQAVGYKQAFNCGAKSMSAWTLKSSGGPEWKVDATPDKPGSLSPKCSLNFNNGKDYACAAGATAVNGTATSPWFDATKVSSIGGLMVKFRYSGRWETNNDDEFLFEWSTDDKKWNLASDMSWTSTSWGTRTLYLTNLAGKKFKVRFRFFSKDCNDNGWVGPFVDDFLIRDMNCTDPKECSDGSLCTLDRCSGGRCSWGGVNCNDSDPCTLDSCKPATGCSNIPRAPGTGCSDSDSCTSSDTCQVKGGKLMCVGTPTGKDGAPCSDSKSCTKGDVCKSGKCIGVMACDDGNACTKDSCHVNGHCTYEVDPKTCDDNNPCTIDVCKAIGANKCSHTAKCDDGSACTTDSCNKATGACTHKPTAGCTNKLPWGTDFNCASGASGWAFKSVHSGGPQWAVDKTPASPKPPTGDCSLNFNDGKGYACPAGAKNVSATATSPWIDATDIVPSGAYIRIEYTISGRWRPSTGPATVYVEVSKNDKTWQVVRTLNYNLTYWSNQATSISSSYAGGKFKVRFRFQSVGCKQPTGDGIFIDRIRVRDIRCYKDSDCVTTSACSQQTCDNFQCKSKGVKCDDGLPCTNDVCDGKYGCRHYPHNDGVPCGSQIGCVRYRCKATKCAAETLKEGQGCNDGDTCTTGDKCQAGTCKGNGSKADGDPCSDSNACTTIDTCAGGSCGGTIGKVEEVATKISAPNGLAITSKDVVYAVSSGQHRVLRLNGNAWVTVAGSSYGFVDGTGTKARFRYPTGIDAKADGTVYVADRDNHRVRVVSPTGVVTTLAGSAKQGSGDGKGAAATFRRPYDVAIDNTGVVVADSDNHRIRHVKLDGTVTTIAGSSQGFTDGKGTAARFRRPTGVAVAQGVIYVADNYNHRIRKIASDGTVTTFAGTSYGWLDGVGKTARFAYPEGVSAAADGTLYIGDRNNNRVRRIDSKARVVTITGSRPYGFETGALSHARWANPVDAAIDSKGMIWVADRNNSWVRKIDTKVGIVNVCDDATLCTKDTCDTKSGVCDNGLANCDDGNACTVSTCSSKDGKCQSGAYGCDDNNPCTADSCGSKSGCAHKPTAGCKTCASDADCGDGKACTKDTCDAKAGCKNAAISGCSGCKVAPDCEDGDACTTHTCNGGKCATVKASDGAPCTDGNVCTVADRCVGGKCTTHTMLVTTLAGEGSAGLVDGTPGKAKFNRPTGIAVDKHGNVFVSDTGNHRVRRVTPWGLVGYAFGTSKGFFDGPAGNARVNEPAGLTIGADGAIYLADKGNNRIRRFRWGYNGSVTTHAGSGKAGATDGPAKTAQFKAPMDVAEAAAGVFYVADTGNHRIRRIENGQVFTVAGGAAGKVDGPLANARLNASAGLAFDGKYLWIADTGNHVIRRLDPVGKQVITAAGKTSGFKDGFGAAAAFNGPSSIAVVNGALWVVDAANHAVRVVSKAGGVSTLIGPTSGFANGGAHAAKLSNPVGVALGHDGRVVIADSANNRVRAVRKVADVCGDGAACVGDYCDAKTGACTFGSALSHACDDGDTCTTDACHASLKTCLHKKVAGCGK